MWSYRSFWKYLTHTLIQNCKTCEFILELGHWGLISTSRINIPLQSTVSIAIQNNIQPSYFETSGMVPFEMLHRLTHPGVAGLEEEQLPSLTYLEVSSCLFRQHLTHSKLQTLKIASKTFNEIAPAVLLGNLQALTCLRLDLRIEKHTVSCFLRQISVCTYTMQISEYFIHRAPHR